MNNDSNVTRLAHFAEQIRQHVNEETASRYMELMRRWISGEIQMDQFDRRGQRLNVPIEVHTKFMLEIGDLFNLAFEDPKNRLIRRKSRKRKNPGSSSTSNTNPTTSPINSPPGKESPILRANNELSSRLFLFVLTNNVCHQPSLMDTSSGLQDRAQDFVNNLLFYAGLTKTPHHVNESGFVVPESPIDQTVINESDVCAALNTYNFLLPDEDKRKLLMTSLCNRFHDS